MKWSKETIKQYPWGYNYFCDEYSIRRDAYYGQFVLRYGCVELMRGSLKVCKQFVCLDKQNQM